MREVEWMVILSHQPVSLATGTVRDQTFSPIPISWLLDPYSCFLLVTMLLRRKGHHNLTGHSSRTCRTTAVGKKGAVVIAETNSAITKRHFVPSQIKASAENRLVSEL